jgi:LytR cell envelope-related transcriptional attenuator
MAHSYPKDRFDEVPENQQRVGAHRAPPRKGRGWIGFGWAAVATLVLIGIGVIGLFAANGTITIHDPLASGAPASSSSPSATPTPTPTPTVNPALNVAVLNGTKVPGLAADIAAKLKADGWTVGTVADASVNNLTQTVVYYSDDANLLAAEAMAKDIPGSTVAKTQAYADTPANLTVALGSNTQK